MNDNIFVFDRQRLEAIAGTVLDQAKRLGASDAVVQISEVEELSVGVRNAEPETIQQLHQKRLGVTLYVGDRTGSSSSSDFSPASIEEATRAAYEIAARTGEDAFAGPVEASELADPTLPVPDLYHPWVPKVDEAIDIALSIEAAALGYDPDEGVTAGYALPGDARLNSAGSDISLSHHQFLLATSRGFVGGYPTTRHQLTCQMIAANQSGMQAGHWISTARSPQDLESPQHIGRMAARRALGRLDASRLPTGSCPVLFEAPIAAFLTSSLLSALSGGAQYRGQTFLKDMVHQQVMASHVSIGERPFEPRGLASGTFDSEGVAAVERMLVEDGVARTYLLDAYSARRLGLPLTGHANGARNAWIISRETREDDDLAALIRRMDRGLLVTERLGGNTNPMTGDFSQGIAGFWVEGGEIRHAVEEVTIAGNMRDMLTGIVAVGADTHVSGSVRSGSILLDDMRIAGL